MPAFVFPGQGSQRPGMGRPWTDHPSWELVDDASAATGRDLARLLLDAGPDELTETRNAQLATVTLSLLVLDAVERVGIEPTAVAGHSVGEYSALIASGALGFEGGLRLVAERGEAMQAAADADPGLMVLIRGMEPGDVDVACRLAEGDVWVANLNGPDETVIAGEADAVERATSWIASTGAPAATVATVAAGGAFHTPLMASARPRLRKALSEATFHRPEVPVVANTDARWHQEAEGWAHLLSAQLCSPVRWHQSLTLLGGLYDRSGRGERLFVELGPGDSLGQMVHRAFPAMTTVSVAGPNDLDRLVDAMVGDDSRHSLAARHHGEHLYVSERVVISPGPGVFEPDPDGGRAEAALEVGTVIGTVSGDLVRSPFAGCLMGMLAQPGERVQAGQPIAWLRAS